jgi:L-arabinose isomerase
MHLIVGVCTGRGLKISLVDAREKFRALDVEYTSVNKAHKLLSINLARAWLVDSGVEDLSERKLEEYAKQDDISDAINQLRRWIITH